MFYNITQQRTKVKAKEALKWYRESEWASHHVQDDTIIETVFHLINPDDNEITGNEQAQMDVLNAAFSGSGFQFNLTNITTYTNNSWWGFEGITSTEFEEMRDETRVGVCETLNVWFTSLVDFNGFGNYPCWCGSLNNTEGVVLKHSTGTGGKTLYTISFDHYNLLLEYSSVLKYSQPKPHLFIKAQILIAMKAIVLCMK